MIRVECPFCDRKLGVGDNLAGKVIACPACKKKFRATESGAAASEDASEERIAAAPKRAAPPPVRKPPPRPAEVDDEDDDERPLAKRRRREDDEDDDAPPPPKRRRQEEDDERIQTAPRARPVDDEDDDEPPPRRARRDEDDEDDEPPRRLKKKKKKKRKSGESIFSAVDPIVLGLIGAGALWLIALILAFFVPVLSVIPMGLGGVLMFAGSIWLLVIAFQDSIGQGILCLICGIYQLIYAITHFDECKKAILIYAVGLVMWGVGLVPGMIAAKKVDPLRQAHSYAHVAVRTI